MIITASIVTYKTDHDELKKCIGSMRKNGIAPIYISDNSPSDPQIRNRPHKMTQRSKR